MSDSKSSSSSGGIGLCGAIFIVFLVLKLTETGMVSKWSWWWVTSPLWIPVGILIVGVLIYILFLIVKMLIQKSQIKNGKDLTRLIKKSNFQQKLEQRIEESKKRNS